MKLASAIVVAAVLAFVELAYAGGGLYSPVELFLDSTGTPFPYASRGFNGIAATSILLVGFAILAAVVGLSGLLMRELLRGFGISFKRFLGLKL